MTVYINPNRTPATPPRLPPIKKVREMMASGLMPISAAVFMSWATARIARPSLVWFTR